MIELVHQGCAYGDGRDDGDPLVKDPENRANKTEFVAGLDLSVYFKVFGLTLGKTKIVLR